MILTLTSTHSCKTKQQIEAKEIQAINLFEHTQGALDFDFTISPVTTTDTLQTAKATPKRIRGTIKKTEDKSTEKNIVTNFSQKTTTEGKPQPAESHLKLIITIIFLGFVIGSIVGFRFLTRRRS